MIRLQKRIVRQAKIRKKERKLQIGGEIIGRASVQQLGATFWTRRCCGEPVLKDGGVVI